MLHWVAIKCDNCLSTKVKSPKYYLLSDKILFFLFKQNSDFSLQTVSAAYLFLTYRKYILYDHFLFYWIWMGLFKIKSEKSQVLLMVDIYIYRLDRKRVDNEYYKRVDNFGGRVIFKNSNVVMSKQHNHHAHGIEIDDRDFCNKLRIGYRQTGLSAN